MTTRDADRYGRARIVTLRRDVNRLRAAIAKGHPIETQEAWDNCERWVDRLFTTEGSDG